jgi:formate C-acetyltransferase
VLEVVLNNGVDSLSGKLIGLKNGDPRRFQSYDELYQAFVKQLHYMVDLKIRVNNYIERMFATYAPATFLSVVIHDCIQNGKDYYPG